ncbi:hypothetical protein Vadar_030280 [Vaccinium darrowii]|uniref:Uncharacterized protein n=1 Tax=Vaccinium darrowii TaxID=229202 RepID=A0ACB7XDC6_9ERIC|nr:hypothetical protein Vadar_030280 [Vaccinium darrowii]
MVVFLMETKNKQPVLERIRKSLHFPNKCYVDPEGTSGGLALWWTDDIQVDIHLKSKNIIRAVMSKPLDSSKWVSTFVYAPPKRHERSKFWDSFVKMGRESQMPWLCIGDFNEISSIWEKQEGAEVSSNRIEKFQALISDCALMDLEFKGNPYTWSNNQSGDTN